MGYTSDVMVVIYPDVQNDDDGVDKYNQLKVLMNTTFKELVDKWFGDCMEWLDERHVLKFDIQSVKWYDSYADVQAFHNMLDTLSGDPNEGDDRIGGYCTEFLRIGEDENDIERICEGHNRHYYLSVHREIHCDV